MTPGTARFGDFCLDGAARRLFCGERAIHLTPKAFDLLVLLIQEAPRVLPKAELHRRLWPDSYVADATLVGLIKEVRRALGPQANTLIRTVHRVGYAFAGALTAPARQEPLPAAALLIGARRVALPPGITDIGRDPACAVALRLPLLSRRHARIVVSAEGATIEDLGSRNGTFVDGVRVVSATPLRHGDRIQMGGLTVVFEAPPPGFTTATAEFPLPGAQASQPAADE